MGYAKEFNHLEYQVPEFLLKDSDWEDVSWHNDVCPRWENKEIGLAVWVDCNEPECREYEDWKQYTVVRLIWLHHDDEVGLADDTEFATENPKKLERWVQLYSAVQPLSDAIGILNKLEEPIEALMDELVAALAVIKEAQDSLIDQEIPDCSPAGEPC